MGDGLVIKRATLAYASGLAALFAASPPAEAQTYATGQAVFASPSGAINDWYSGCIVKEGRSNDSYQVECGGTVYWISSAHISTSPPAASPDPMSPGRMQTPVVTPSHPGAAAAPAAMVRAGRTQGRAAAGVPAAAGDYQGVITPAEMHRRIQQDNADARTAKLDVGKYECRIGGRYTFSDLYITGPNSYRVEPGGSGTFRFSGGNITFTSGPYAGTFSQMVDGRTVGISSDGTRNLATQCERQ
jgi:hypothetical protein